MDYFISIPRTDPTKITKHIVSILMEDESGTLTRLTSLFSRRSYNIESIAIGPSEVFGLARVTVILIGTIYTADQLCKQVTRLLTVTGVELLSNKPCVERELMLVKLKLSTAEKKQITELINVYRARILESWRNTMIIELTGDPGKIMSFTQILQPYKILQIARTGNVAMQRSSEINSEVIKELLIDRHGGDGSATTL